MGWEKSTHWAHEMQCEIIFFCVEATMAILHELVSMLSALLGTQEPPIRMLVFAAQNTNIPSFRRT